MDSKRERETDKKTDQGSHSISKIKFPGIPRLCLALFPDPSEVQVLVLCNS